MSDGTLAHRLGQLTYDELGAIDMIGCSAADLGFSPLLVRYAVRTNQLNERYPAAPLAQLLAAIDRASIVHAPLTTLSEKLHATSYDPDVDAYLNRIQPRVHNDLYGA